jgi:RNA polymerase sigma factor (TIGR02999 family)
MSDPKDGEDLRLSELYPQLRRMAAARMALEPGSQTLQPTALVHEAWLRLTADRSDSWKQDARQLFAAASESMRRVLIDRARRRSRVRHGGDLQRVPLETADSLPAGDDEKLLLIHEAVERLEKADPLRARVVVLRFFGGLSNREIAAELSMTERTVERYWSHAKAWLYQEIKELGE